MATDDDVTILRGLRTKDKKGDHRLYYYQGNFFYPLELCKKDSDRVSRAIRMFKINHKPMIEKDRADPSYKTLLELDDEHK